MSRIISERMTAEVDNDFVVFLIGMQINKLWKIHKWLPSLKAMSKMIDELYENPQLGFISHEQWFGRRTVMIQYWRSFEELVSYARNGKSIHLPAWVEYNNNIGSNGDVGIWHETYLVKKGQFECVYNNMPEFGLAKATRHVPAEGANKSASGRLNAYNIPDKNRPGR